MSLLIGVDLGTTETKAGLFDGQGRLLRLVRSSYPILSDSETGAAEQDPTAWWNAICDALGEIARSVPPRELDAICVAGQGPSVVAIDGQGRPVHNAILWLDTRVQAQRQALASRMGHPVFPFAHTPLAMWLEQTCTAAARSPRWFLSAWDYITFRLCGKAVASTLAYFEPFPADEVAAAGLPEQMFPALITAGQPAGEVTEQAARETGLPAGLTVVAGAHDGIATFLGAALVEKGRAADVDGTSGGLALCWDSPVDRPGIFSESWLQPGQYIVGGAMASLGRCLDWARQHILGGTMSREEFVALADTAPPGSEGLLFLPYLSGERAPIWDAEARGVLFGLALSHRREHVARAVLESVAFALRHLADEVMAAGAVIAEMYVCGGQAQSQLWNQIKCDVLGLPVSVPRVREAALLGAAILAAVGSGLLPDAVSGATRMFDIEDTYTPDPSRHARYSAQYAVYRRLYPDLKEAFHQLSTVQRARDDGLPGECQG
jgi:xylulokinase